MNPAPLLRTMRSEDWYRNKCWDAEVEAAFNDKLSRARSQKAQYLRIQGSLLKESAPDAAIELLMRSIEEGDDFHIAHAHLDIAHANCVSGNVDAALEALEAVLEQEERQPNVRTTAAYDFAFLVALHQRQERYDRALALLEREGAGFFATMLFEAEAARALIYAARGNHALARQAARKALAAEAVKEGWIPGYPDVGVVPANESPLLDRLRTIAGA